MNIIDKKLKVLAAYDKAANNIVKLFCDKHEYDIDDMDVTGTAWNIINIADYYLSLEDIMLDIIHDRDDIHEWYSQTLDRGLENKQTMNFISWIRGLRYDELDTLEKYNDGK